MELGFYCLMFIGQIITLCFTNNYKCDEYYHIYNQFILPQHVVNHDSTIGDRIIGDNFWESIVKYDKKSFQGSLVQNLETKQCS